MKSRTSLTNCLLNSFASHLVAEDKLMIFKHIVRLVLMTCLYISIILNNNIFFQLDPFVRTKNKHFLRRNNERDVILRSREHVTAKQIEDRRSFYLP